MNAKDSKSGRQFGIKDLWIESILLLVAGPCHRFCFVHTCADRSSGSDTTAAAMCATFFHLAHYPTILKQVIDEVKAVFRHADDIVIGAKLDSCRYLQACVDEAMRLDPSTPNPLPRCTQSGGAWVDGEPLPEGTILSCSQYAVHRNPAYFPEPNKFCPERWLCDVADGTGNDQTKQARRAFNPFGVGPRTCVGWKLALTEIHVVIAKTVFLHEIRVAPKAPCCHGSLTSQGCEFKQKSYAVAVVNGPNLQFRKRV
jgi:hypothetical protein